MKRVIPFVSLISSCAIIISLALACGKADMSDLEKADLNKIKIVSNKYSKIPIMGHVHRIFIKNNSKKDLKSIDVTMTYLDYKNRVVETKTYTFNGTKGSNDFWDSKHDKHDENVFKAGATHQFKIGKWNILSKENVHDEDERSAYLDENFKRTKRAKSEVTHILYAE